MADTKPLQHRVRAAIADAIDHARHTCMDLDERDVAQVVNLISTSAMAEVLRQTGHREARLDSTPATPVHRVLLDRLADERAKAVRNAPLCRIEEVRWVNEGMAGGLRIAEAHVVAMFEGSAAVAEYMRGQGPEASDGGQQDSQAAEHRCGNCEGVDPETCLVNPNRSVPDAGLQEQYAAAARTVQLRLGPNAIGMAQRGEPIRLSGGEADAVAEAVLAVRDRRLEQLAGDLAWARQVALDAQSETTEAATRAETAEAERDRLAARVQAIADEARGSVREWLVDALAGLDDPRVPRTAERAEQAEAAVARVRAAVHVADTEDVTEWQRGYRACSERTLEALDTPAAEHPAGPVPPGRNAEDFDRCAVTNPPYPFICPGHPAADATEAPSA